MATKIHSLLKMKPVRLTSGWLFSSGLTASIPTDGLPGYETGCLYQATNGGAGTSLYVNEGTEAACDFDAVMTEDTVLLTATAGVVTASKALIASANGVLDFSGLTPLYASGGSHPFIAIGTWSTPMNVVLNGDHWVPIQVNLKNTGSSAYDIAAMRLRVDTGGATPLTNHNCVELRQSIAHNVNQSSILQASVSIDDAVTITTGECLAGYFSIQGTGTVTPAGPNAVAVLEATNVNTGGGITDVVLFSQNGTGTTVPDILHIKCDAGTATAAIKIENTGGTMPTALAIGSIGTQVIDFTNCTVVVAAAGKTLTSTHAIPVKTPDGVVHFIFAGTYIP